MKKIYLDNAATTALDPAVLDVMLPYLDTHFGNPSSTHSFGRKAKRALEESRKTVADLLNTQPKHIIFTSGGTEADNMILHFALPNLNLRHLITSHLEHKAVLTTLTHLAKTFKLNLDFLPNDHAGHIKLKELENYLAKHPKTLVSLMHANNEIGNMIDIEAISNLCQKYGAFFHSDSTQTIGHFKFDLQKLKVDALVASAHKFHGPKGVGFLYLANPQEFSNTYLLGGRQEWGFRGGTENISGIIGLTKALEIAMADFENDKKQLEYLKKHCIKRLKTELPVIEFNGLSADLDQSLYTVLSLAIPPSYRTDMLLFKLDLKGIAASGMSACSSGSQTISHVIEAIGRSKDWQIVRLSFSKYNTLEEIDYTIDTLKAILTT